MCVSVKVSVDQDQRSHQRPHVQGDADPAGGDLHPHRWPLAGHGLVVGVRAAGRTDNRDTHQPTEFYSIPTK